VSVLVVGSSGKTGLRVTQQLLAQGAEVRAMVRRQEAAARLEQLGAQSVVADLNYDVAYALRGCEALVFAAGAPLHGDSDGVDYRGTVRLIEAAEVQGVRRFVLISSLGTSYPERLPLALRLHLEAKRRAEVALEASGLDYTVVKPGALTDAPGCGRLELAPLLGHGGSVPRDDVAELVSALVVRGLALRRSFEVVSGTGEMPAVLEQLRAL
jgi:uncharacterized protein YbjT (DUF2867 family)